MKIMRRGKIFLGLILPGMVLAMATGGAQALATQSAIPGWTIQNNGTYVNESGETCADSDEDGYYTNTCSTDCDDGNANINPSAQEICSDNDDNNCDGQENEWCPDSCSGNGNFFSCFSAEISTNLSSLLTSGLTTLQNSIRNLLTTVSNPASNPSAGKISSSFDQLSIGNMAGLNPANSSGLFLINNTENIGSAFVNTKTGDTIGVGISTDGKVGAVGIGTTTGVLVEKYTGSPNIVPKIGISAQASGTSGIGLYAVSSVATGTDIRVSDLGLYSTGSNVGIVSKGTTGISVTATNPAPAYGDIIGAVMDARSNERVWGALGYALSGKNYSLFTPFSAYSDTLEVVGDTNSNILKAKELSANNMGYMGNTTYLDTISASGSLTVKKPLAMSGDLEVNGYLDIDGNVTVDKDGGFKMDGDLKTNNYKPIAFTNDVEVSADSGSADANIDGKITAADGIGTFYQMKGSNTLGNPTVACRSGDFLVSCSAKVENSVDLYVGARPKNSTTCEAYAQKSKVTVTVYAYCFDPQGTATSSL